MKGLGMLAAVALAAALASPAAQAQAPPGARLNLKNNTRSTIACTLLIGANAVAQVRLGAGKEYSRDLPRDGPVVSLSCPALRAAPYSPLAPGKRYAFLRVSGQVTLTEVTTP